MNHLVKILFEDDGSEIKDPKWCLLYSLGDTPRTFCDGQAVDGGSAVIYEEKYVQRRGITCEDCLDNIRQIKAVKI